MRLVVYSKMGEFEKRLLFGIAVTYPRRFGFGTWVLGRAKYVLCFAAVSAAVGRPVLWLCSESGVIRAG